MNGIEKEIKDNYDVVVVGAGNGGLAATAQLAKVGKKVLLLEQHNLPGGFASSFVRGRFEFETSLHELASYGPKENKGSIRTMFEDKFNLDADFMRVPEAYRLILTDPEYKLDITLPFGIENFIDTIEKEVPDSKDSVKKFFDVAQEIRDAFEYIGKTHGKPDQGVLIKEFPNFLKTAAYSTQEVEDALGIPERAQEILNGYWAYLGLPISRINFTIFASMVLVYIDRGGYIPKNRSHEYTTAFDAKIREYGGKIEYNTRVEKILVENGKVIGVETSKGDRIKTNFVICNASPTLTYNKLIYPKSEVPEIAYKDVNARLHGLTGFCVYLGLDASVEELGINEYSYFIMDSMVTENIYDSWKELKKPAGQATVVLNVVNPDCSPSGTSIMYITTLFKPEAWENIKPEVYFRIKNELAEKLIIDFERATGTSIREHIEEIEVATPVTYARFTRTYKGIIYGYEPESWDSLIPRLMMMGQDVYIKGLEFAGGFGRRVHGYSSAMSDGYTSALLTLQELSKKVDS
jgi:prolycopene isomerase